MCGVFNKNKGSGGQKGLFAWWSEWNGTKKI